MLVSGKISGEGILLNQDGRSRSAVATPTESGRKKVFLLFYLIIVFFVSET